jgi:hypothetical protein
MSDRSEADLLALMRADREVQNRRRDYQAAIDHEATEEAVSAAKIERADWRRK